MTPEQRITALLAKGGQCCTPNCIGHAKVLEELEKMQAEIDRLEREMHGLGKGAH